MSKVGLIVALAVGLVVAVSSESGAADKVKAYQVTGPVVELTDTLIVVMKDDEKWELARDANTKVEGELKVGAKVTIKYRMTATSVDVKAGKADEKVDKAEKAAKPAADKAK